LTAELARGENIDGPRNILVAGNSRAGESNLTKALTARGCAKGYRVPPFHTTEQVTALIEARTEPSFLRLKA
jgi:hypothetical protein